MEKAIEIRGVEKRFGQRLVLRDVSFAVPRGSVFGFVGPNGAGKTTAIRIILGLLRPDSGSVSVLGLDSQQQPIALRRLVGYVAEESNFYPWMRIDELMGFHASFYPRWDEARARELLETFNLHPRTRVRELSKGMRTQLGLTLALAHRPELLVLDEPTSGLDPVWRRRFLQALAREATASGATVFFSTHILSDVERIADWIAIIHQGSLRVVRPLDDLKYNQRVIRVVFQGSPPADLLAAPGIKAVERDGQGYLITVEDNFDAIYQSLQKAPHFVLEQVEQDLENIFLDYTGEKGDGNA
ncbi:MAG TPA: ABC transporter ATP-binding protein [Bacillota bacterium]|nr:ABC transporter ATP-binding protein [Bacillota bacterium]HPZ90472.1 ABC transporter ATP-binding protein [Bacillota bacterium]HQE02338.1 ABC transporter ATP-binding protein [Bacillota bacterium]